MINDKAKSDMMSLIESMNAAVDPMAEGVDTGFYDVEDLTPRHQAIESAEMLDMKNFLSIIVEQDEVVAPIRAPIRTPIRETRRDNILAEALVTSKTLRGARVGDWEIVIIEEGKSKRYDVIHSKTESIIARNLYLGEAASSLVSALNSGKGINDPSIRPILEAEDEYARCVVDAAHHMRMLKEAEASGDNNRAGIFEARLSESRGRAKSARERVRILVK